MSALTLTGARVLDPASGRDEVVDVTIEGGCIARIGGTPAKATRDVSSLALLPGLIDMRVSTGEPGEENRETLASAARAAVRGGVTTMVVQPDTRPVIDDQSLVEFVANRARELPVNVLVAGALTVGLEGERLTELGLLREAGAVMFASGPQPVTDTALMRRILLYASTFDALVANRCVEPGLAADAHESAFSSRLGLRGEPGIAETVMAARDIALARDTGARVLLDLVSSREVLSNIARAKAEGARVHASTTINHLALNEIDIGDYRTFAKLRPPLRSADDRAALLAAVADGTVDIVVSDHDPQPSGAKRRPFADAAPGAVGVEIMLSVLTTLAANGEVELMDILPAMTSRPAELLGLESGRIAEGAPADLALVDLNAPWVCDGAKLASVAGNTPFDGRRLTGKVVGTWVGGVEVFGG